MYEIVITNDNPMWTHELQGTSDAPDPLDGAIEKWQYIVNFLKVNRNAIVDNGSRETCPLCWHYWEELCHGCPIREWTGLPYCQDTPYERYYDEPTLATAQTELEFLYAVKETQ